MLLLAAGFVLSLIGSLPPGLISLTVAFTAIRKGIAAAFILAAGAAFAEFFQALLAVALSDWFLKRPGVASSFEWAASIIFFILACYLMFFAKPPQQVEAAEAPKNAVYFINGILVSAFNLLAIPYWFTYCSWLKVEGWWRDGLLATLYFACGVSLGTLFALGIYGLLGNLMIKKATRIARHANRLIGLIFLGLAIKLWIKLFGL